MTQQEHLNAIVDKCRANLALAEKRTPPEFVMPTGYVGLNNKGEHYRVGGHHGAAEYAAFIAACAGAAEAGWLATIGRIKFCEYLRKHAADEPWLMQDVGREEAAILAAWPEELLK